MLINFICGPYLTFKAVKKILEVMNNKVNDTFSKISIWILKLVVVQEVTVMVALSWVVVLIVYDSVYGHDPTYEVLQNIFYCLTDLLELMNDTQLLLQ